MRLSSLFRFADQEDGREDETAIAQVLAGKASAGLHSLVREDSSSVPVSWIGTPLHIKAETAGAVLVLHDMTQEQKYISASVVAGVA